MMPLAMWRKHPRLIHHLSLYAPLLRVAPTIVTIHDLIHLRYPNIFHRRSGPIIGGLYAPYYSAPKRVITDDARTVNDLEHMLGVDPLKIRVIPLGVDELFLSSKFDHPNTGPERERPYVIYVGNHRPHKNLTTLMQAWAALPTSVTYDLVVTGSDDFELDAPRTRTNGARLFCLGDLPEEDLHA